MIARLVSVLIVGMLTVAGCAAAPSGQIVVGTASSLKNVLVDLVRAFEAAKPGTTVTVTADASSNIEAQIEQAVPYDVFLSADTTNPQKLVDKGFASGSPIVFARNELTVIVPAADPAGIASPADMARPGVRVIAAQDTVPITKYANSLVTNLAGLPDYPAGFADAYTANILTKQDSVAAVVAQIELGEGDVAICYVTDAAASTKVTRITIPVEANVPATYAGVVIGRSTHQTAAKAFMDWLLTPAAGVIFASFGFLPPS